MSSADWFVRTNEERKRLAVTRELSLEFAKHASEHDRDASFPHENVALMRESGYTHWTVGKEFGGEEISLYEMCLHQEQLASGDGSTALAIGWHVGMMLNLRATRGLPSDILAKVCTSAVERGALINSCATEPATGSPSRGGRPQTTAVRVDGGYLLNGRKTFSTLSPELDWILVTAGIEGEEDVGEFLLEGRDIEIEETWNTMGMRATGSHDILLKDVFVPEHHLVSTRTDGRSVNRGKDGGGWMLHIPACYLGIAKGARDFVVRYAATYQPNSLPHPISEVSHVQEKLGRMELLLFTARTFMYDVARRWDEAKPEEWLSLRPQLAAVKTHATNTAIEVLDLAMRVAGGRSLWRDLPLERMYRDIRAGLHNPPMDDITYRTLSQSAVREVMEG